MKQNTHFFKIGFMFVFLALTSHSTFSAAVSEKAIQSSAITQINSILAEKASRTPVEAKIDSNLLGGMQAVMQQATGLSQTQPGYVQNFVKNKVAADSTVKVTIRAKVTNSLLAALTTANAREIKSFVKYNTITARLPITGLPTIAARSDVQFIEPFDPGTTNRYTLTPTELSAWQKKYALLANQLTGPMTNVGAATSQGVIAHAADRVQQTGIDGAGVKVCVLSDGVKTLAARQATGDLPAVDVVAGQAGSGDEGTAMLEIIHDMAPAATLGFATANGGEAQMATNIQTLRNAPHLCDIIVDDYTYYLEPPFQEGIIAQAVATVTASGASYFSSSANSGSLGKGTSGTWEGDFVNSGTTLSVIPEAGTIHSFNGSNINTITRTGGAYILTWGDPQNASVNDYDLFILNSTLTKVLEQSTNRQTGSISPWEFLSGSSSIPAGSKIVVLNYQGHAQVRALRLDTVRGRLSINTTGSTFGHNGGINTITTAAVDVGAAGGGSFFGGAVNPVELNSSDGPRRLFFNPNGTQISAGNILFGTNGGTLLKKVDNAAADCVVTTTPGFAPFCGTSAAAPHAAAIAALIKSAKPNLTNAQIKGTLLTTALDIEGAGYDYTAGNGLIMADASVRSVLESIKVGATFSPNSIRQNEISTFTITLTNPNSVALQNVALTDNYPASLKNAGTVNATFTGTGCSGNVTAVANGGAIGLSGATILAGATCALQANVTSGMANTYSNSTGTVTTPMGLNANGAITTLTVASDLPDFVVSLITLSPTVPLSNGNFSANVTVKNQGTVSGNGGDLDVWANQPIDQTCPAVGNAKVALGILAAGESKTVTIASIPSGIAGAKTLRVFVDSQCQTAESNVSNNQSILAYNVAIPKFALTVMPSPNGVVKSTPTGINCGSTCIADFDQGAVVNLSQTANPGYVFAGWGGACSGTGTCTATMDAAKNVSATFNPISNPILSVTVVGAGVVMSNPDGINCGATCSANFPENQIVTLTAIPKQGYVFAGWSGGGCGTTTPCVVTLTNATSVTAQFNPGPWLPVVMDYLLDD